MTIQPNTPEERPVADKMTVEQALKAIQTEVNYHAGSDTHYRAERLEQSLATLRAEIDGLGQEEGHEP